MGDEKNEKELKPQNYTVKLVEGMAFTDAASADSISAISGSIKQSYGTLAGTFSPSQSSIANSLHIDQNFDYLKKIAELLQEQRDEAIRQRKEADENARKDRNRFYVGVLIGVIGIVAAVIVGILPLL